MAIAILPRLSLPKTLAVIHHGVGRDYRGTNDQRRLATGTGRARDAVSKPASLQRGQELSGCNDEKHATIGRAVAALVTI
jgi:hypothetical protein